MLARFARILTIVVLSVPESLPLKCSSTLPAPASTGSPPGR